MLVSATARRLVRVAGGGLWLLSGVPAMLRVWHEDALDPGARVWLGAFLVFGAAFWWSSGALGRARRARWAAAALAVQAAAALVMFHVLCTGFESALLVLVAAQLGLTLPLRWSLPWIAAQTIVMGALGCRHWGVDASLCWASATAGFELLALLIAGFAAGEARARADLARANADLRAARARLAEASRADERVRIARDLHDGLGHHLTALSLHLEVARHAAGEAATEALERARGATRQMLGEVREVVATLRDDRVGDLAAALRELAAGVDAPRVHLALDELDGVDDAPARAIVRAAQELVTNAIRHAAADHVWLEVRRRDGGLALAARDDGRAAGPVEPGCGLRGLRERFEGLGGSVTWAAGPAGFRVEGWLPLPGGAP